ncbi:MAG: hypothetical protein RL685_539 [Pseudomonadota bacterium]|jgi:uncharacterized iron-regulated membrane protein
MTLFHSWAGLVLGGVLFAAFWMGTLSVFDCEIDRWMMPTTRLAPAPLASLDEMLAGRLAAQRGDDCVVSLPSARSPILVLDCGDASSMLPLQIDPATGRELPPSRTLGASGFIVPFHFSLQLGRAGMWLIGFAAMGMLALLASGVIIHRRIVRDLFTFRPRKALLRSSLDLHAVSGVLALPFHVLITLSGLILACWIYFPGTWARAYAGDSVAFARDVFGGYWREPSGLPAELSSLDAMVAEAERRWGTDSVESLSLHHMGDAAGYVEVRRAYPQQVSAGLEQLYFDAPTATLIGGFDAGPLTGVQRAIAGTHLVKFQHWPLRWLYFLAGIAGCVTIVTGLTFWLEGRRERHAHERMDLRLVDALTVGSVTGIMLATLAFLVSNRLLPASAIWGELSRQELEVAAFFVTWLSSYGHAAYRGRAAWRGQCIALACMAAAAVLLNWCTTAHQPLRALARGSYGVAGMDAVLLVSAVLAWGCALRLRPRATVLVFTPPGESASLPSSN